MNASQFLQDEHKRIIGLLRQARASLQRTPDRVVEIGKEIVMELEIYFQIKKDFTYTLLTESQLSATAEIDQQITDFLQKFKDADRNESREVVPLLLELTTQVEECFSDEEHEVIPLFNSIDAEPLLQRQIELKNMPQYADSRPETVQNPNGGEQQRRKSAA